MREKLLLLLLGLSLLLLNSQVGAQSPQDILKVCLNIFILGDTGTDLERNVQFSDPKALLGDPAPEVRERIETVVGEVENIWMQCQMGFSINLVKVIRTQKLMVFDRPLLEWLDTARNPLPLLREALKVLKGELEQQGLKLSRYNCLHVFVGVLRGLLSRGYQGIAFLDDTISAIHWRWASDSPIWIMAHEIGHTFGLDHVNDPSNLMWEKGSPASRELLPWQCEIALGTAAGMVSGWPPNILRLEFPAEIPADGTQVSGFLLFEDRDGDVKLIQFDLVEGDFKPFSFDPQVAWVRFGRISFSLTCTKRQQVTLRVTLVDEKENRSEPVFLLFKCV